MISQLGTVLPGAAILALVGPDALDAGMRGGAGRPRAFVIKPSSPTSSWRRCDRCDGPARACPQPHDADETANGRIVVFCAPKGGTGRTTMAINTA